MAAPGERRWIVMSVTLSPEELYVNYRDKVTRYISSHVSNEHDREDLVQQVFLNAVAAQESYDSGRAAPGTWLYVIARNAVTDYFRRGGREPAAVELDELCGGERYSGGEEPEERLLTQETLETLAEALEWLSERERNIVIWRFYHGLSAQETAERAGVSYANARFLQHQALKKLQKYLTE